MAQSLFRCQEARNLSFAREPCTRTLCLEELIKETHGKRNSEVV